VCPCKVDKLKFDDPVITQAVNFHNDKHSSIAHKSHSLTAWLWLFRMLGQAKALMKLSFWPGLAWIMASGWAMHITTNTI